MDKGGIIRGKCSCENCDKYFPGPNGLSCGYCGCLPVTHVKLSDTTTKPATSMPGITEPATQMLLSSITTTEMKPCMLLLKGHIPYSVIFQTTQDLTFKGVFKIAYEWNTIFVSRWGLVIPGLRKQFTRQGNKLLYEFMSMLNKDQLKNVSVFWVDEAKYDHKCKPSYKKCITALMGRAPIYNN